MRIHLIMKRASQNLQQSRMIKSEFHELTLKANNIKRMKSTKEQLKHNNKNFTIMKKDR